MKKLKLKRLSPSQTVVLGFAVLIFVGAFLLCLPVSSNNGTFLPFEDALFTAVSAVCVTGLVVADTATYFSVFGQVVLLLLIQIGGLGVITVVMSCVLFAGKRLSVAQNGAVCESISSPKRTDAVKLVKCALIVTASCETAGACALMPSFCLQFGGRGVWLSVFHSVSAFCNAGFDLMGTVSQYSSLTHVAADVSVNIVIMTLIVLGGLGFATIYDVFKCKFRLNRCSIQSKVILIATPVLIAAPAVWFFFTEFRGFSVGQRILLSLFQSVTTRTAGFNTADLTLLSDSGKCVMILLMLVGGAPGSTAGGMKITTLAILFANMLRFKREGEVTVINRRVEDKVVKTASALFFMYTLLFALGGIVISTIENLPLLTCLFETASAIGTVGLSLGITSALSLASKFILIVLMFFGRVGGVTLVYATILNVRKNGSKLPLENINVG